MPNLGLFSTSAPTDAQMNRNKRRARKQKRTLPEDLSDPSTPDMTLSPAKENLDFLILTDESDDNKTEYMLLTSSLRYKAEVDIHSAEGFQGERLDEIVHLLHSLGWQMHLSPTPQFPLGFSHSLQRFGT